MKNYLLICLFILFLFVSNGLAQSGWNYYKYKDLPVHGMSWCIQSDYSGGVFLGMACGLAKFNGDDWVKVYYNELNPMDASNEYNIRRIKILNGMVWTGTNQGLIKFNGYAKKQYSLTNTPSMYNDKIRGLAPDQYGNIWFVNLALGIFKLDNTSDTVIYNSIPQSTPLPFSEDIPMFCDGKDNLWYSCSGKIVKFKDGNIKIIDSTEISDLKNDNVQSIQIMYDNSIAVTMKKNFGIIKENNGSIVYQKIDLPENLLEENEIFSMIKCDLDRNLWILSRITNNDGIHSKHFYKYSKNKEWTKYEFPLFDGTVENKYALTDFTIDENEKVWFSDPYYGIFVFDSKATSVENIENNNILSIFPNPVTDILSLNTNRIINKIEIFSVLGIKVFESDFKDKIDVSLLVPGVYYLKTENQILKFMKI